MLKFTVDEKRIVEEEQMLAVREVQTFVGYLRGMSCTQIGLKLHLSVKTISVYTARIVEKLDLTGPNQLMAYGIFKGYVKMEDGGISQERRMARALKLDREKGYYKARAHAAARLLKQLDGEEITA